MATISHKKIFIVHLNAADGTCVTEHDQKANLLWVFFKNRLGVSEFTKISYNLESLLSQVNLENLDEDFSQEEINLVIRSLPNSHAPGPDGFMDSSLKHVGILSKQTSLEPSRTSHPRIWTLRASTPLALL